jgi:hopanoid biosynthesis associated protein HpnK
VRRLIVNADDFGLTGGINRAVAELHDSGALNSATLMAEAPRFAEAVALARQCPLLGVGCHIVLVDGSPAADASSISSLLDSAGDRASFRSTLGVFARDLYMGRISRADIEREAAAQILRLQKTGVPVTHIDTHKHTHMFPAVLDAVMRAAKACGIHAIRNPFEPAWSVAATPDARSIRKLQVRLLDRFRGNFWRLVREREFVTTDGCLGVLATGTLDETALRSILNSMPEGTWELVCHPAYLDDELRATHTRLQESRAVELSALQSLPGILDRNVHRIHFGQL